jgi:Reverse transcriptase (RNA-dependent DNA polymerase)
MVTPISTRRLCYDILKVEKAELLALLADADNYYRPYDQVKIRDDGSKKIRHIEPSTDYLKVVQRKIDRKILKPAMESLPAGIMGGRKGVSVINNAGLHAKSKSLMKYDVKDFFPSIKYHHVYYIFRYRLNYCEEAANILTKLTTFPSANAHVPQGAPTSTSLAAFSLETVCIKIEAYTKTHDLNFSVWVDDITISGDSDKLKQHRLHINHLVNSTPFTIHPDKNSGIIKKGSNYGSEKGRRITGITIDNTNRLTLGRAKYKSLKSRVRRARAENQSLRGSLQFLKQVSPSQGKSLYHLYHTKVSKPSK